jgi:hypothetical protein
VPIRVQNNCIVSIGSPNSNPKYQQEILIHFLFNNILKTKNQGKNQYLSTNEHYLRDKRNELIKVNQPQAICQPSATYLNNDRNLKNIIDKTSLIMLHSSKDDQFEQDFGDNPRSQSIRFTNDLPTLNSHVDYFPISFKKIGIL